MVVNKGYEVLCLNVFYYSKIWVEKYIFLEVCFNVKI